VVNSLGQKGIPLERATQADDTLYFVQGLPSPGSLIEYFLGYIHPQALTSCLASVALSPRENSYVLDMCAAPGGKTSHLAQLMDNTGLLVANELYLHRHIPLGHTLTRLGVLNTVLTAYQAQEFPLKQRFDYILADVPCSGEGRLRGTKEAVPYRERNEKTNLPELQKKIILRGFDLLQDNREAEILPVQVGLDYQPGILEWRDEQYDKQLELAARFYPHIHNSVGFFLARIGKGG
jgi:16S rRNA C967 or C1407 C5-methylase (RsmB/RsmF family)